ncbi:MAG: DUF4304 domain-containing protein [Clostridia bacterium]|nr:DUF4304 domain-containing protein [Clostridia bacterium]
MKAKRLTLFQKTNSPDIPKVIDEIENEVYYNLKPLGFKKYCRTLHRFVSGDISQVINFQSGQYLKTQYGFFCVNIGIRVPECVEKDFHFKQEKNHYKEYECNIRSRLGGVSGKKETWFDTQKSTQKLTKQIVKEITEVVIPVFDILNSRENILAYRRQYPTFDTYNKHLILLEESMIYGHLENTEKAKELFELYYQSAVDEYNYFTANGHKQYLKKGERVVYMGQDITAEKDGYVTLYGASHAHIDLLDELAAKLKLR